MHGKKPTRTPACSGFYRSSPPPCKPESRRLASTLPCQRYKVHHGEGGALKRSNLHENCLPFSVKPQALTITLLSSIICTIIVNFSPPGLGMVMMMMFW